MDKQKPTPGPCPHIYPSFMSALDQCIAAADNEFLEITGRWAVNGERALYIARIKAGEWPIPAAIAAAAIARATGKQEG